MSDAGYYDNAYLGLIADPDSEGWVWLAERVKRIAPLIIGESVLDLGCGLAAIADAVDVSYYGIDYSRVAYEWNCANVRNPKARFGIKGIYNPPIELWDTVLVLEVLEHIQDPDRLCHLALHCAKQRVIVTVPVDMPGKKHYHPTWTGEMLLDYLGTSTVIEQFGGPENDRWWLAVKDT